MWNIKMKHTKKIVLAALTVPVLWLSGCKSIPSYSSDYQQARTTIQGVMLDDQKAFDIGARFTTTFDTLGTPNFVENATNLYEEKLFINDRGGPTCLNN